MHSQLTEHNLAMQAAQSPTSLYLPEGYRGDGGGRHNSDSNTGAPVSIVRSMSRDNGVQQSTRQSLAWLHTVPNVKKLARRNRQKEKRSKQIESQVDERGFSVDKWRGLLLSVAKTSAMYAERYTTAAETEKLASREKKGKRARNMANQMAIQNGCRAKALVRLASLAHQLHVRNPPCDWCMLMAVEEVARCEIVSLIYAAARVDVQPLTEALDLLRLLFPEDIDSVQQCKDSWLDMVDPVLLAALTECPIDDDDEKQKIDTVSGLFRVVPLKAIENKIGDGGIRNVKLENRALFQTLGQNEHVAEDRKIGQRNSSTDADRNCMVLAKDVPIVRPVPVRSNNTLQIVETLVQDTSSTPKQSIEILKDKVGVTPNGALRNIATRNSSTESEIDEIQPQISVATQSDKSCASKPNIAENDLGELEDIIVPVTEVVAEPSRPNIPVSSNNEITTHAIATESTSGKSLSSSSTKASPANAGGNDEHYVGMTEEKHDNPREKHNDASTTITATVGITNSLSEQVPPISDDVSSTSRQHQQQRKQLTTKSKDQTTTALPTSSESSINKINKEIPRIPPLFGAAIAKRTNSDREARRSSHASTRFSIDFLRRSLDNASTVGSSVTTTEESDDQQGKQGERGGGNGSTATTATSKLKANIKNRVRRSRVSSDLKRERERNSAPTGKRRAESQKFSRRSLDESAKEGETARKASWVKKLLRKRRAGAEGFARSTSIGNITTFTKRYTSKRFVDDAEILVSDIDMSKSLTRATLLACYPGVSGVRNRQENEWILRFGNRDNALNYLKDEKAITNTFGQSAKVELLGSCVQAA